MREETEGNNDKGNSLIKHSRFCDEFVKYHSFLEKISKGPNQRFSNLGIIDRRGQIILCGAAVVLCITGCLHSMAGLYLLYV